MKPKKIKWLPEPEPHDFPAAADYLRLHMPDPSAYIYTLERAPMTAFKAKDIFRASGLPLLGISNLHVQRNRDKIDQGKPLSPLLLVRHESRLIVADGYHRLCTVYALDEDAEIPCKIV